MWLFVVFMLLLLGAAAYFAYTWRRDMMLVGLEAETAYKKMQTDKISSPMAALSKSQYRALYSRVNLDRTPKYGLGFLVLAVAGTVPVLAILALIRNLMQPGQILWGLIVFFGVIVWWATAFAVTLRFFRSRKPGSLEEEYSRQYA